MSNNTSKTIIEKQIYRERNREKCLEKGRRYYEKGKKGYKEMVPNRSGTEVKENSLEIDNVICLKRTSKN